MNLCIKLTRDKSSHPANQHVLIVHSFPAVTVLRKQHDTSMKSRALTNQRRDQRNPPVPAQARPVLEHVVTRSWSRDCSSHQSLIIIHERCFVDLEREPISVYFSQGAFITVSVIGKTKFSFHRKRTSFLSRGTHNVLESNCCACEQSTWGHGERLLASKAAHHTLQDNQWKYERKRRGSVYL